jgi:hypothetical protein
VRRRAYRKDRLYPGERAPLRGAARRLDNIADDTALDGVPGGPAFHFAENHLNKPSSALNFVGVRFWCKGGLSEGKPDSVNGP